MSAKSQLKANAQHEARLVKWKPPVERGIRSLWMVLGKM